MKMGTKLKKCIVVLLMIMLVFSNIGFTIEAIATSEEFKVITKGFFRKDEIKFNAYFEGENGKKESEAIASVNERIKLTLEIIPQVEGYLKSGLLRAVAEDGTDINFRFAEIKEVGLDNIELESEIETSKFVNVGTGETEEIEEAEEGVVEENSATSITNEEEVRNSEEEEIEEELINEEEVIEEILTQIEEENRSSEIEIVSENEIEISNVLESTKIEVELEFKQESKIKIEDLYKKIKLQLSGTYINSDLEEVEIGKEEEVTVGWKYSRDIHIGSEYTKFSPFKIGETSGTIVENKVTVRRETVEEKYLPLKRMEVEITVPKMGGKAPRDVKVQADKLMASKGEEFGNVTFGEGNWNYDEEKGIITIEVTNEADEAGYVNNNMGDDEYIIVYRYDEYTEQDLKLSKKAKVKAEEYSAKENNIITDEIDNIEEMKAEIGELITYTIGTTEEKINKGKINANYNSNEAVYETEYTSTINVNILTSDMLEELKIDSSKEYYIDNNGIEFEAEGIRYKRIKFGYNQIKEIVEAGGIIEVYSSEGTMIYTLNKELIRSEEDCTIEVGDVTGIVIYIKNITTNGTIAVEITKAIGKCNYDMLAFKNFVGIESRVAAQVKYAGIEEKIELEKIGARKTFEESYTSAKISINKESLATLQENEDVEIKIELNNNEETMDLYKNPCFEIVFPKYVTEVEVESVHLIYEEGLKAKNAEIYKENDIVKMRIELEGAQTRFSEGEVTNGSNIIINAKIKLNEYTPRKQDQIKLYYYNEGATNYESQTKWSINKVVPSGMIKVANGFDVAIVNYQAPTGLIAINGIKNYDGESGEIRSVKQGEATRRVTREKGSHIASMEILALNNTGNTCTDVVLLGRMPFKGNKNVITNEDLGTTTDVVVKDIIKADLQNANAVRIYYSNNANANKNLNDSSNGWNTSVENISEVKSYLIVVNGEVEAGASLKFEYDFEIPENLAYETKIAGSFGTYYNNNTEVAVVYESNVADVVGITTEAGPKVEATMTVDIGNGASILEDKRMKYTITVANIGSVIAENITVENKVPEYTDYTIKPQPESGRYYDYGYEIQYSNRELNFTIEKLEPGEIRQFDYLVTTKRIPSLLSYASKLGVSGEDENGVYYATYTDTGEVEEKQYISEVPDIYITNKATIKIGNLAIEKETNEVKNLLKKANFSSEFTIEFDRQMNIGVDSNFKLLLRNISGNDLKNVQAVFNIEKELAYISGTINENQDNIVYDNQEHKVYFNIGNVEKDETIVITAKVVAENIQEGIKLIPCYFEFKADNITSEVSTTIPQYIIKPLLEVDLITNPRPESIKEDETIDVQVKVTNIGKDFNTESTFECEIPDIFQVEYVKYSGDKTGGMSTGNGTGKIVNNIPILKPNESIVININLRAKNLPGIDSTKAVIVPIVKNANQDDIIVQKIEFNIINNLKTIDEAEKERIEELKKDEEYSKPIEQEKPEVQETEKKEENETQTTDVTQPEETILSKENETKTEDNLIPNITQEQMHSISGTVWLDENRDGEKNESEKTIPGIKVQLYKSGNMIKVTTSDGNGKYVFNDLSDGKYIIVFEYNKDMYVATTYMKASVADGGSSKAIENENGKATSNSITISNTNVEDINLGLQLRTEFDLSISKYITKATVITGNKSKEYEYNDEKLAKVEIAAKDLKKSTVEIEYKIVVENIGSATGNVVQIIDDLPSEVTFNQNKNEGWYLGNDGKLYYDKLKETKIEPGQKKEIKLILSKKMTEENTGVISNKVEIGETLNQSGLTEDTKGNSTTQELIISIKTGEAIRTTIFIVIIGIMIIVIIKQRVIIFGLVRNDKSYKSKTKVQKISMKKFYK